MRVLRDQKALPSLLTGLILVLALGLALRYALPHPVVSDTVGYLQAGRQLSRGEGLSFHDSHNGPDHSYYTLYSFKVVRPGESDRFFSYSPGAPALIAAFEAVTAVGGVAATHLLPPLAGLLLLGSVCALGALLGNRWSGLWAGLTLLAAPVFLYFATDFWSEIPGAALLYLGFLLCLVALRQPYDDLAASGLALAGGVTLGWSFFMRPSSISLLPALPMFVWMEAGRGGFRQLRSWVWLGAIALSLLGLLLFNWRYYGAPLASGYSPIHGWYAEPAFSLSYAFGSSFVDGFSVAAIARQLGRNFGWLLPFVVIGVLMRPRKPAIWLVVLTITLLAPYAFYAFAAEGINARFLIPAWGAVALLAGRGIAAIGSRLPGRSWRWLAGLALVVFMFRGLPSQLAELDVRNRDAEMRVNQAEQLAGLTEPNAVMLTYAFNDLVAIYGQRSALNYRHLPPYDEATSTYRYDQFEPLLVEEISRLLAEGTPVYYVLDRDPPLLDSYEILRRHFELQRVAGEPMPLFKVNSR